jgi:uncharacterized protein
MTAPQYAANKQVALKVLELISKYEFVAALELLGPEAVWWEFGRVGHNKAELLPQLEFLKSRLTTDGMSMQIRDVIAEGDRVALTAEEVAETVEGKRYSNAFTFWFTVRDGLVTEVDQYHDSAMVQSTLRAPMEGVATIPVSTQSHVGETSSRHEAC